MSIGEDNKKIIYNEQSLIVLIIIKFIKRHSFPECGFEGLK